MRSITTPTGITIQITAKGTTDGKVSQTHSYEGMNTLQDASDVINMLEKAIEELKKDLRQNHEHDLRVLETLYTSPGERQKKMAKTTLRLKSLKLKRESKELVSNLEEDGEKTPDLLIALENDE